ncbi:hypothetical protein TCAL_06452 [Tigriopus californicus]|uniref:Uncharacterized protein n=2 Tax=Tigriopus californicus TaxID=6832 RepID=A0A553PLQ3_TIGCA|nr:hypothetical protein TCAL_06452 [Tigriopus californicus]
MNSRFSLAVLPRTERGRPLVLSASPDGNKIVYCHGHSVIIREVDSPQYADIYTQHACDVNVAKYSPSGFYIASADKSGKVRIWDTVNAEHILKNEFQPLSGPIYDLAWSGDNQRMVVVGQGREKFGHVFLTDTGTSNGDISGQSRPINSCDFKSTRPFRIITGSEDNTAAVYEGPPFKFSGSKTEHTRYCQVVRYSKNGHHWASAGFDGHVYLYDGKDSSPLGTVVDGKAAHEGGIYGLDWNPESTQFVTASGDKKCKIWDLETKQVVATYDMGDDVASQQLGCIWVNGTIISVSLSGNLNYLDPRSPPKPRMIVEGHNKPITAFAQKPDQPSRVFTGSSDGRVIQWDTEQGLGKEIKNNRTCQVNALAWQSPSLYAATMDDVLSGMTFEDSKVTITPEMRLEEFKYSVSESKLPAQARGMAELGSSQVLVLIQNALLIFENGNIVKEEKLPYEASCLAASEKHNQVIIGEAAPGQNIYVYNLKNTAESIHTVALSGSPTSIAFSPCQSSFVTTDSNRKVTLFKAGSFDKAHTKDWGFHTAKVLCAAFSPNGHYVASGGLDCSIILWSVDEPSKHHILLAAHTQSPITRIAWLDDSSVLSTGQDGNVKIWNASWKKMDWRMFRHCSWTSIGHGKGKAFIIRSVPQTEHVLPLMNGVLKAGALNSIFFGVYGSVLKTLDKGTGSQSTYGQIFAAGFVGGFLQLSVACPVDLIKIKLQTQTNIMIFLSLASANTLYRGPVDALLKIFSETGIVGLYRGFWIMALRDCPSFGVYVIIYDTIMARISDRAPQAAFFSGGIAGVVSWLLIMPLDVVKSQMQADCANNPKFTGMSAAALACYRERGWRGFFKGSLAVALRAFPVNGATFVGMASSLCDFSAGWFGGVIGLIVGHPFDTLKVRQQSLQNPSLWHVTKSCFQFEGVQGFFKGMYYPLLSAGALNSLFFGVYGMSLNAMTELRTGKPATKVKPTYWEVYWAGCAGGAAQLAVSCPVDLAKIRLQTQIKAAGTVSWVVVIYFDVVKSRMQADCPINPKYNGTIDTFQQCYREGGIKIFGRGMVAVSLRAFPLNGATFLGYEYILDICRKSQRES